MAKWPRQGAGVAMSSARKPGSCSVHSADSSGVAVWRARCHVQSRAMPWTYSARSSSRRRLLDRRQVAEAGEVGVLDAAHLGPVLLHAAAHGQRDPQDQEHPERVADAGVPPVDEPVRRSVEQHVAVVQVVLLHRCRQRRPGEGLARPGQSRAAIAGRAPGGRRRGPSTRRAPRRRRVRPRGACRGRRGRAAGRSAGPGSAAAARARSRPRPTGRTAPRGGSRAGRAAWHRRRAAPTRRGRRRWRPGSGPGPERPPTGRRTCGARTRSRAPTP